MIDPTSAGDSSSVDISFAGYSTAPSVALGSPPAAGQLQIEGAYLSIEDLRFRPADRCGQAAASVVVPGPLIAELVERRTIGLDRPVSLPRTRYCRLELRSRRAEGGSTVASLAGQTVVVRGRRADGVPFLIRSARRDTFRLLARDPKGFAVRGGGQRLFVGVDLGRWMEGVDLAPLVPGRGKSGIIRIDERSHRELLRRFEQNLGAGLALCGDLDDDGVLTARECASDHRLASPR